MLPFRCVVLIFGGVTKKKQAGRIRNLKDQIRDIDILVDQGGVTDDML
ncbi:hypothetical protein Tco_0696443, partial [Tanacetum coccineum]